MAWSYALVLSMAASQAIQAQVDDQQQQNTGIQSHWSEPIVQTWEFGLEITSPVEATGLTATIPVPQEWPEQQLRVLEENQDEAITRMSFRSAGDTARQLEVRIRRLEPGETVRATVVMEIHKRMIEEPDDVQQFRFGTSTEIRQQLRYLAPSPFIESRHPRIRDLADSMPIDEDGPAWEQVRTIYEWVRENIRYEFDTEIRTCLEALDRGQGDCEEMSSLFIAICRARGIPARAVWIPDHTYAEFFLVDEDGQGNWFPCQLAGDYAFGAMIETRPILQKGDSFRLQGHRERQRYVIPTLVGRDAAVDPEFRWIMRPLDEETSESNADDRR